MKRRITILRWKKPRNGANPRRTKEKMFTFFCAIFLSGGHWGRPMGELMVWSLLAGRGRGAWGVYGRCGRGGGTNQLGGERLVIICWKEKWGEKEWEQEQERTSDKHKNILKGDLFKKQPNIRRVTSSHYQKSYLDHGFWYCIYSICQLNITTNIETAMLSTQNMCKD